MTHLEKVKKIQGELSNSRGMVALKRDSSCCSRSFSYKAGKTLIDISFLNEVLEIDVENKVVTFESLITMEQITRACLAHHLRMPVTTEFRHMTVGGAIQGLAGESSSFKHGLLDESVIEYEMILPNGDLTNISKTGNPELFSAIPGSYGSFGIVSQIKMKLVPAHRYIRVCYSRVHSFNEVLAEFELSAKSDEKMEFIEAIALSPNDFRISKGYPCNTISLGEKILRQPKFNRYWSPWYYNHLDIKSQKKNYYEYLSTEDYLFRWDRGAFWASTLELKHSLLNRILFGRSLSSKNLFKHLYQRELAEREQRKFYQDMLIPAHTSKRFFDYLAKELEIYPIWLIPIKASEVDSLFSLNSQIDPIYLDFGVWGKYVKHFENSVEINRKVELEIGACHGRKCLWGQAYYTEEEFWNIYNKNAYDRLRKQNGAESRLTDIYTKVTELFNSDKRVLIKRKKAA